MFEQFVVIEWKCGTVWVERLVSDNPITIDRAAAHYQAVNDFDEDRDSLDFVDAPETIKIDDPVDPIVTDNDNVCPDSPNDKHRPDWGSVSTQHDGDELYVDVNCTYCGASGCVGTSTTLWEGINW